jgi:hypothetical protein
VKAKHKANGLLTVDASTLPQPEGMSLDFFLPMAQIPRTVRYGDQPIRVGEEWTVDNIPASELFSGAGKAADAKAKASLSVKGRLVEIKEYQGKKVAILKVELKVTLDGMEVAPGMAASGEFTIQLDVANYLDTGVLIEANAKLEGMIHANMQGTPFDLGVKNTNCQWRTPGAETGAPAAPATNAQ